MSAGDELRRIRAEQPAYMSGDHETFKAIVRVLRRLPDGALELAHSRCVFASVGGAARGQCLPVRDITVTPRDWLILLDDRVADLEDVIAEEVAHAYDLSRDPNPLPDAEREKRARDLIREWGFTPIGPDSSRSCPRGAYPGAYLGARRRRIAGWFDSSRGHEAVA
jgi:hypothetical protein